MSSFQKVMLLLSRLALGWLFLYAGLTKVLNPAWSAEPYLQNAATLKPLYLWLSSPALLPLTNFLNEWGLTLLGIALILGICVRISSYAGVLLMVLYYFPILKFPLVGHSFLVDEHIVYSTLLLLLAAFRAGRVYGLETWCANLPWCKAHPKFRAWIG